MTLVIPTSFIDYPLFVGDCTAYRLWRFLHLACHFYFLDGDDE